MKVHQAFLRRKTDCQSIGRINIKPSSKGYANDSDVFLYLWKSHEKKTGGSMSGPAVYMGTVGIYPPSPFNSGITGRGVNPLSYAHDMGLSPLDLKNSPPGESHTMN